MEQTYQNDLENPLETMFYFPVDINFGLSKIRIDFTDQQGTVTTVETIMEERVKAEQKYEDAVAQGDKLAVIAQHVSAKTRNMVKVCMGNFPAKGQAKLTCFMYSQLAF